jgi:hypothetical protein
MMSIGLLVDLNQKHESPRADLYHRLARASLCEMNLMDEPNLDLIQTLVRRSLSNSCHHLHRLQFYMIWYLLIFSDKSQAVAYAWSIMGLAVKLAQSVSSLAKSILGLADPLSPVGSSCVTLSSRIAVRSPPPSLDRDGNRWKVIPEESQRRRMLFWELLNLDARLVCATSFFAVPLDLCPRHFPSDVPPHYVSITSIVAVHRTQPLRCTSSQVPNHVSIASWPCAADSRNRQTMNGNMDFSSTVSPLY